MSMDLVRRRSRSGWSHVRGVLSGPARTYAADYAASFWGMAFVVACVSTGLAFLIDVRAGAPAYVLLRTPVWAALSLLAQRGITGVARRVCGGDPDVSRPTASQAAIVMNGMPIPALVVGLLLPVSTPAVVFVIVFGGLALASLVVAFWVVGQLYGTAFYCSVGRGVVGEIVGVVTVLAAFFAALVGLGVLLNG